MLLQALILLRLSHALLLAAVLVGGGGRELGAGLCAVLVVLIVLVLGIDGLLDVSSQHFVLQLLFGLFQVLLHCGGLRTTQQAHVNTRLRLTLSSELSALRIWMFGLILVVMVVIVIVGQTDRQTGVRNNSRSSKNSSME